MSMHKAQTKIDPILKRYSPEHDLFADAIQVNWVDHNLAVAVELLLDEMVRLRAEVETLRSMLQASPFQR